MAELKNGTVISTESGESLTIDSFIAEGGQGYVYKVTYKGQPKALKLYKPEAVKKLDWFHDNIREEIKVGALSNKFIWPEDLTVPINNTFGYIMPLKPPEYVDFDDILLAKCELSSFYAMANCALNIVSAFRLLHRKGYAYQDLNNGNFFIRLRDGDVLICDNDNVSPEDNPSGIAGKARYMSPSVVMGGKPNRLTDRFSLAVCLFLLFIRCHPLEGVKALSVPEMNDYYLQKHYGKEPLFIADPVDHSNGPNREIHRNFYLRWPLMTNTMKQLFTRTFSQEAMLQNESKYPLEIEWCRALLQFRTYFFKCPLCEQETFLDSDPPVCKCCGRQYPVLGMLKVNGVNGSHGYKIPLVKDVCIFREHLDDFSTTEQFVSQPVGMVRTKISEGSAGLTNISKANWTYTIDGKIYTCSPKQTVKLRSGMAIRNGNRDVTVHM